VSSKTAQEAASGRQLADSGLANASALHDAASALLLRLPAARRPFFQSHLLVQTAIQRFPVEAIASLSNATAALAASAVPTAAAVQAAKAATAAALASLERLMAAQRAAEGTGEWRGLYWADRHRFTNLQARRRHVAWHSIAQHSIAQHSTAQHSTAQHSTAQHSMAWHGMAWHGMAWHGMAWHGMAWHGMA
jgi:hypothetical protein